MVTASGLILDRVLSSLIYDSGTLVRLKACAGVGFGREELILERALSSLIYDSGTLVRLKARAGVRI